MKVKDLVKVLFEPVCIYRRMPGLKIRYEDLYSGKKLSDAPLELLDMEVRVIGTNEKGIIEIQIG